MVVNSSACTVGGGRGGLGAVTECCPSLGWVGTARGALLKGFALEG